MKKLLLPLLFNSLLYGQTAVNFNVNDCSGNNHILFNELDAGKVVIITWVMPCSTCIGPALSAQTEAQNFVPSNPGKIKHYIADDYANTNCTSLSGWCTTNGLTSINAVFSDAAIKMLDYGSNGMPKTVILAGTTHSVFFNENNTLTVGNFVNAMNNALAASNSVGMKEVSEINSGFSYFPNPASSSLRLIANNEPITSIELIDPIGNVLLSEKNSPNTETEINLKDVSSGIYLLKVNGRFSRKVIVSH